MLAVVSGKYWQFSGSLSISQHLWKHPPHFQKYQPKVVEASVSGSSSNFFSICQPWSRAFADTLNNFLIVFLWGMKWLKEQSDLIFYQFPKLIFTTLCSLRPSVLGHSALEKQSKIHEMKSSESFCSLGFLIIFLKWSDLGLSFEILFSELVENQNALFPQPFQALEKNNQKVQETKNFKTFRSISFLVLGCWWRWL